MIRKRENAHETGCKKSPPVRLLPQQNAHHHPAPHSGHRHSAYLHFSAADGGSFPLAELFGHTEAGAPGSEHRVGDYGRACGISAQSHHEHFGHPGHQPAAHRGRRLSGGAQRNFKSLHGPLRLVFRGHFRHRRHQDYRLQRERGRAGLF
ncbi:hypothetical protein SDC9_141599 [bioreactor metagenome]|uniref:Uncharacterized protein n=1 Tax=bioreactor metagenome TaxID=1076179 RepID=A0A645E0S3_9ZZZZ